MKICNSLKLKKFSDKYFEKKSYLTMVDGYFNSKDSHINDEIVSWHTDQAYGGANLNEIKEFVNPDNYTLKFFIYLTDVYKNNGCMSYIPGSHKITYLIRKGIFERKLDYKPYWSFLQIKEFISDEKNKSYILENLDDESMLNKFLKKLEMLEKNDEKYSFDYSMKSGDAIVFNEGIVHRGSRLMFSDRMVLRFHFRPVI